MKINTVDLLGITFNEKIICNLIVGLINNSYNFRAKFLKNILEIDNAEDFKVEAQIKIGTSKGIPDIVVVAENKDKIVLSIIDNKLKANDGHNQTIVYSEHVCVDEILCDIGDKNHKDIEIKYVYLNLINENDKYLGNYINKSYKNLVEEVWVDIEDEGLDRIYKDFCIQIEEFYSGLKVSKEKKVLDFLLVNSEREKSFIRFRELLLSMECPQGLNMDFFGKIIGKDKDGFVCKIINSEWLGKEAQWFNGIYRIDEDCYDIHIELDFDILNKETKISLHYEPNPYVNRRELNKWSTKEGAESFERRRSNFINILNSKIDCVNRDCIKKHNGVNTIVFVKFHLNDNLTIEEFKEEITDILICLLNNVDETFKELKKNI